MGDIKAVLFDFDGTLVDTEQYYRRCCVEAMAHFGIDRTVATKFHETEIAGVRSDKKPAIFANFFPELNYPAYQELYLRLCDEWRSKYSVTVKPGAKELLTYLKKKGLKLAVVTMSTYDEVRETCAQVGLDFSVFDFYFGGAGVPAKPRPDVYLEAMRALEVTPAESMVVEDSNVGALAGIASGAKTVVVPDISVLTEPVYRGAFKVLERNGLIKIKELI